MQVLSQHSAASLPPSVSGSDVALPNLTSSYVYPLVYPVLQTNILERVCLLLSLYLLKMKKIISQFTSSKKTGEHSAYDESTLLQRTDRLVSVSIHPSDFYILLPLDLISLISPMQTYVQVNQEAYTNLVELLLRNQWYVTVIKISKKLLNHIPPTKLDIKRIVLLLNHSLKQHTKERKSCSTT